MEQAFVQATVDEEIYIELPEEYQDFPRAVGRLNNSIDGLVQARFASTRSYRAISRRRGMNSRRLSCVFRKIWKVKLRLPCV